eukprot:XP_008666653.1 uncharacterized protein LOC103645366 [Zea mays]
MGYREAATHIQLWLLGALVSHSEFDVVDFLICEIEDTTLTQQQTHLAAEQARQAAVQQQLSERMLSMFQKIQDRQDSLQQQLLQDRADNRDFMTLMLQHTSVSIPLVQSAPPPPLQAAVVPALQAGPPLPTVGPSSSPLRPVTLVFTSPVISSISPQPLVPPASVVTTAAVAVSVTSSAPAAPAVQLLSESVPATASTADPGSETDSDPQLANHLGGQVTGVTAGRGQDDGARGVELGRVHFAGVEGGGEVGGRCGGGGGGGGRGSDVEGGVAEGGGGVGAATAEARRRGQRAAAKGRGGRGQGLGGVGRGRVEGSDGAE